MLQRSSGRGSNVLQMMKSATRVRVGSHNIHGGLMKTKEAIGAAPRNFDILALQISFKSHGSFPPVGHEDSLVSPIDDNGDWSEWDEESCSDDEPAAKRARGTSAHGEWLFIRHKAKINVLEQHAFLVEERVSTRWQLVTQASKRLPTPYMLCLKASLLLSMRSCWGTSTR